MTSARERLTGDGQAQPGKGRGQLHQEGVRQEARLPSTWTRVVIVTPVAAAAAATAAVAAAETDYL